MFCVKLKNMISKNLLTFLVLYVLALTAKSQVTDGERVGENELKYLALIEIDTTHTVYTGGGIIIDQNWILTCAHLFYRNEAINSIKIMVGSNDRKANVRPAQIREIPGSQLNSHNLIIHDKYVDLNNNRYDERYDIALISLHHHPLEINNLNVIPAVLAAGRGDIPAGSQVTVAGWGWEREEKTPRYANKGRPLVLPQRVCKSHASRNSMQYDEQFQFCYAPRPLDSFLPTHYYRNRPHRIVPSQNAAKGDSGGPVINENGIVVGIIISGCTDYGIREPVPELPGVAIDIRKFREWIDLKKTETEIRLICERDGGLDVEIYHNAGEECKEDGGKEGGDFDDKYYYDL